MKEKRSAGWKRKSSDDLPPAINLVYGNPFNRKKGGKAADLRMTTNQDKE